MGKTSKSITALSAKQKIKAIKAASLQKVASKAIKKKGETRKNDLEELKQLLKLDAYAPIDPVLLDGDLAGDKMEMDDGAAFKRKYLKPGQKARRRMKLLKANPQREKNPTLMCDRQVKSAE